MQALQDALLAAAARQQQQREKLGGNSSRAIASKLSNAPIRNAQANASSSNKGPSSSSKSLLAADDTPPPLPGIVHAADPHAARRAKMVQLSEHSLAQYFAVHAGNHAGVAAADTLYGLLEAGALEWVEALGSSLSLQQLSALLDCTSVPCRYG